MPQRQATKEELVAKWTLQGRRGLVDSSGRLLLKNLTYEELHEWCQATGEREQRTRHIWRWLYHDGLWMRSMEETVGQQDGFGPSFRAKAVPRVSTDGELQLLHTTRSSDGTQKLVFALKDGGGTVETVLIPVMRSPGNRTRLTICVSSQVGCAMNCQFCFTGRMGLRGNLSTAQIIEQVVEARRLLASQAAPERPVPITNLVFMGMGEPLDNLPALLPAIEILTHPLGLHFGQGRVTVSTVGLVPQMQTLMAHNRSMLAVSLHATTDEVRDWICPVNRRWPLASLLGALKELFPRVTFPSRPSTPSQSQQALSSAIPDYSHVAAQSPAAVHSSAHPLSGEHERPSELPSEPQEASCSSQTQPAAQIALQTSPYGPTRLKTHASGRNFVMFEYVMLAGVNDTAEDAHRLLLLTQGIECKYNLIEFNSHPGTRFQGSDPDTIQAFRSILAGESGSPGGTYCFLALSW
ncbi:hypothetical protein WJX73_006752 [Symbiochloris irregularis]|uniref:Radical SAM core domain-containing protein n=1 Tax=Symbiochloris irregularis TaxID=706552 RepID=A0AAW1PBK4_9CHLO